MQRQFGLGPPALRDIACRREHAGDVAVLVVVGAGVVEHVGDPPGRVANRQLIVGDGPLGENLAISRARLLGLGEVIREIAADQTVARNTGDGLRRLVDIGDLAVGADRDQRIEARLDQAARVEQSGTQSRLRRLLGGDVAVDLQHRHPAGRSGPRCSDHRLATTTLRPSRRYERLRPATLRCAGARPGSVRVVRGTRCSATCAGHVPARMRRECHTSSRRRGSNTGCGHPCRSRKSRRAPDQARQPAVATRRAVVQARGSSPPVPPARPPTRSGR